jgi:hypothetical protein
MEVRPVGRRRGQKQQDLRVKIQVRTASSRVSFSTRHVFSKQTCTRTSRSAGCQRCVVPLLSLPRMRPQTNG